MKAAVHWLRVLFGTCAAMFVGVGIVCSIGNDIISGINAHPVRETTHFERFRFRLARHAFLHDKALTISVMDGADWGEYEETAEGDVTVSQAYYNAVFAPGVANRLTPAAVGLMAR